MNRYADIPAPVIDNHTEEQKIIETTLTYANRNNPKILLFIDEFMRSRDLQQAADYAKLSYAAAKVIRKKKDVSEAITKLTNLTNLKFGYDPEEIVERTLEIANANLAHLQKPDGSYYESLKDLPPHIQRTIKKFKVKNEYETDPNGIKSFVKATIIEVELYDKIRASELLANEKGIFKKTTVVEHEVSKNMAEILLSSVKRAEEREAKPIAIEHRKTEDEK